MRIFITGATGFVGSAIVRELIRAGHQVLGLARSEQAANSLALVGAEAHRSDLEDLEGLRSGADQSDGVIHAGFIRDYAKFKECCEIDRRAIEALGSALEGSARPLLVTSAIGILPQGQLLNEDTMPASGPRAHPRAAAEMAATALRERGVDVSIIRLPPSVHGEDDRHGLISTLVEIARAKDMSVYAGDGLNRWSAVHRFDAARLYRLVIEKGGARQARYHAVAEEGISFREIATVIGSRLSVPVDALSPEEAAAHFGWFAHFAAADLPSSGKRTQEFLDWQPEQPGLIADLNGGDYFHG